MYKELKQTIYRLLVPFIKFGKYIQWLIYLRTHSTILLNVGAGTAKFKKWFATDIDTLDITKESDFKKYFKRKKINKILAEHVLEHLTNDNLKKMAQNFFTFSSDNVNIRIAVPDGFHTDKEYIERVKPGGTDVGANEHKNLFNYKSLTALFEKFGFKPKLMEYWDEDGIFHSFYTNDDNGFIERSFLNDDRNKDRKPNYTSLIIDFSKK